MKVSVIIPTYNRENILPLTLESLKMQDFSKDEYEIIIVDNNSTDNTEFVVRQYIYECNACVNIRYVKEVRQGDVYARNTGAAIANGVYLFFTDDDANFDSNWISCMVNILDEYPQVAMVGSRIAILWDEKPDTWVSQYEYLLGKISMGEKGYIISSNGFCIPNGSLAIRKSVFLQTCRCHVHQYA